MGRPPRDEESGGDLWGGRFQDSLDEEVRAFSTSLPVDIQLLPYDIQGSLAHLDALHDAGVVDDVAAETIRTGLEQILEEYAEGAFPPEEAPWEDVHSAVEARLNQLIGEDAGRLRAGRSRNDQVVTDMLLWLRDALQDLDEAVAELQEALLDQARENLGVLVAGHTHLQKAQPVLLAHLLLAHMEALERDRGRLADAGRRADRCPLGAAAFAGTSFPLDRRATAERLGFARATTNAADSVADRDWAVETAAACALLQVHLSRLSEDLILWSSEEFGWIRQGDGFSTGSSIMPQKKNPDVAELVRGKAGRVVGDLVALLTTLKGLPLTYNRDLQEDKDALFDAVYTTLLSCQVLAGAVAALEVQPTRASAGLRESTAGATDLADLLVRRGIAFSRAHDVTGRLVARAEARGEALVDLDEEAAREVCPELPDDWRVVLDPRGSVEAKATLGSTSPREVKAALARWEERLGEA